MVEVAVDPVVTPVQPHFMVAVVAPAGEAGNGGLVALKHFQVVAGSYEIQGAGSPGVDLTKDILYKLRAFKPPVAEELGVVRANHYRGSIHN